MADAPTSSVVAARTRRGSARLAGVGVAGLGRMGHVHAANIARSLAAQLVRVVDSVDELGRSAADELHCDWSTSFTDLLDDRDIDAIVVATPTALHASMIEAAARAGKHVFAEKPLATDLDASAQAVRVANAAGVLLQVGFHRRFDPDWAAAQARLAAGELGAVYLIRTSLRERTPPSLAYIESAGEFFDDFTIHDFDCARWMVGEIVEVAAYTTTLSDPVLKRLGYPDQALIVVRFASGALGVIDNSRTAGYGYECSTEIVGSRATVRIGGHQRAHDIDWLTPNCVSADHVSEFAFRYATAYRLELEHFVEAVRTGGSVAVTGNDAVAAGLLARAAATSVRERRAVRVSATGGDRRTIGAPTGQPMSREHET